MSSPSRITEYEEFVRVHGLLLAASGIPRHLHRQLFHKLLHETFDAGDFFSIEPCEAGRQRRLVLSNGPMEAESHAFLIDHAWTFRLPDALKMLKEVPGLAERMAAMMCVDGDVEDATAEGGDVPDENVSNGAVRAMEIVEREAEKVRERGIEEPVWLELEELGIDDDLLRRMDLSNRFPNLVALNLWGNKLQSAETVLQEIKKCWKLKAVWLNENPVVSKIGTDAIIRELPELEILNSCFTINYSKWSLGFCQGVYGVDNPGISANSDISLKQISFLDLSNRNIHKLYSKVLCPDTLPALSHLNLRGNPLEDSTDDLLELLSGFSNLQILEVDIPGPLGSNALKILESLPNITSLNGVSNSYILESGKLVIDSQLRPRLPEWSVKESLPDRVIAAMWLYLMTYRLADEEKIDETPAWYVMDELGSALRHSDEPNFKVAPFLLMPEGRLTSSISYSVLWPLRSVQKGEECTRDFLFGIEEEKQRSARLTAWFHTPEHYFIQEFHKYNEKLLFQNSISCRPGGCPTKSILPADKCVLLVYTDIPQVRENLSRSEFEFTSEPKDADIIWTSQQVDEEVRNAVGLTDHQYINQFPFEACIVMKHYLADTIHRGLGSPEWLQPTYNLEKELSPLIGDYVVRKQAGLDNLWILKPWNMARTIDTTITGDLSAIIRLMETGPKICQKYIQQPALLKGKKFDLRYVVFVRSINPVEIFLYDVFWVRLANNMYSLDRRSLSEYETHFTVNNYRGTLNFVHASDFIKDFEEEHQVIWLDIHKSIRRMIRDVFDSAAAVHPEMHCSSARAIYGIDVMIDSCFKPKLLEVTYCPDCTRACKFDTAAVVGNQELLRGCDFYNKVFGCLFLDESRNVEPL